MNSNRASRASRLAAFYLAGALLAHAPRVAAQPGQPGEPTETATPPVFADSGAWSSRLTPSVAQQLLASSAREDRVRGIQRLAAQRDFAAIQLLLRAISDNGAPVTDPAVKLEAIRAVAPFASRDPVRRLLVEWMADAPMRGRSVGGLASLAQQQAAMALAATGDLRAVEQLVIAVADGGDSGDRAFHALLAHPPPSIDPLLSKRSLESAAVLRLLGRLGDLRAIPQLRKVVDAGDLELRAEAAVALARMGDSHGMVQAHKWLHQDGTTHPVRLAAAQTLATIRDPEAPRAVAIVLADSATRTQALQIAAETPTPQLAPTLAGLLTIATPQTRPLILMTLARCGGPLAVRTIERLAIGSPADLDAAFALANCRDPGVSARISRMFADPALRRLGVRIAVARLAIMGDEPHGLDDAVRALAGSKDPSDRATSALARALTDAASVQSLARSDDQAVVAGACRASLAVGQQARAACAQRLHEDTPPALRDVLALSLVGDVQPQTLSTRLLLLWAEQPTPSAPVFARCLGVRDDDVFRARLVRLLQSGDPVLRSQLALGMGRSPARSAVQLLVGAYAFEAEALVRRAIIRALSRLRGALADACLRQARLLDPDDDVRSLARLALAGHLLDVPFHGHTVAWVAIDHNGSPALATSPISWGARMLLPNGFAISAAADRDGLLLVPGLPAGTLLTRVTAVAPNTQSEQR